jgi:hypothetical protein
VAEAATAASHLVASSLLSVDRSDALLESTATTRDVTPVEVWMEVVVSARSKNSVAAQLVIATAAARGTSSFELRR